MTTTKTRITMKIATMMMIMSIPIYSNPYQLAQLVEHRVGPPCSTWSTFNGNPPALLALSVYQTARFKQHSYIWDISDISSYQRKCSMETKRHYSPYLFIKLCALSNICIYEISDLMFNAQWKLVLSIYKTAWANCS